MGEPAVARTTGGRDMRDRWEKQPADRETFARVLAEAIDAVGSTGVPFVTIGGLAAAQVGRPRWTQDVDLLVRPQDADEVLRALAAAGFDTQRTNPHWIYKAVRDDILIDVIFRTMGDIYLDQEIRERAIEVSVDGCRFPIASPEDLVVIKAAVSSEECPHHWNDALGIIAENELDWEYLLRRARRSARRTLSLLIFAQAADLVVPTSALRQLFHTIYDEAPHDA